MSITTISSREFNQDTARAKKAAAGGPVFNTDRGRPVHVLLTMEGYLKLTASGTGIVELLSMPEAGEIDFEVPRVGEFYRIQHLS